MPAAAQIILERMTDAQEGAHRAQNTGREPFPKGTVKFMNKMITKARKLYGVGVLVLLLSLIPLPADAALPAQSAAAAREEKYADVVVYPGGTPFGVRFGANEVTVLRLTRFSSSGVEVSPAADAGILPEDVIRSVNGVSVSTIGDVVRAIETVGEKPITLTVKRKAKEIPITLTPEKCDENGSYRLGVLLKDTSAGIGTVTYIKDDTLVFGGLGHGICDSESGKVLEIGSGYISNVKIGGVNIGKPGAPGELCGSFDSEKCGKLIANTEVGLFGMYSAPRGNIGQPVEVAEAWEVSEGPATILCTLDDNRRHEYNVEIAEINRDSAAKTKNYVVRVTDERLLAKTGGIVQGMSGSPILQGGKLVGAVTHVMVNDPTTGYGIYIGNMLDQMNNLL